MPIVDAPARVSLSGDDWELWRVPLRPTGDRTFPDRSAARPYGRVTVPGNVQLQAGLDDVWTDRPELTSLNDDEWLYVRTFDTGPVGPGERRFLEFAGVDYFCDVWVDGTWVGHHEGQFGTFELEITDVLARHAGSRHELVVAVSCPWRVDDRQYYLEPSTAFSVVYKHSEYMKGNLLHYWDGLPLSGYAVFPFGLWEDVRLSTRRSVMLRRASVATVEVTERSAEMELTLEWWAEAGVAQDVELDLEVRPVTFDAPVLRVPLTARVDGAETRHRFTVPEPRRWWTWDTGPQDRYEATVRVRQGTASVATVFGIRTLRRDETTLAYYLNGQRLYLRGVWYPFVSIFTALPEPAEQRRDVEMLRDGNINHIVAFTFIEREPLYEACDELGILIFQELPYHQLGPMKAVDPAHPRFDDYRAWSLGEVADIVRQRRGHASVVLWSPFAETRKQGTWLWQDYTDYVEALEAVITATDTDALFHASFCDFGEEHIWNGGFPFGEFWDHYDRDHRFISEFGAISPPNVETLRELMPPEALWGRDEGLAGRLNLPIDVEEYSYRWSFDYSGLATSVARMYRWADRRPPTLERFVDAIQWYQALGLRYCAEVYRRKRFASIAGSRTWSYRENTPGIKFTVVDHRQRPKIGYFGLAAGYEPVLLSIDDRFPLRTRPAGGRYMHDLWAINDTTQGARLTIEVGLFAADGARLAGQRFEIEAAADSGAVAGRVDLPLPSATGPVLVRAVAHDATGAEVTRADTWVGVVEPAFARELRVLLLGQARYNAPVRECFDGIGGIRFEVVDETNRHPQDSSWAEGIAARFDAVWFTGWDAAIHYFRPAELAAIADAVRAGVGFVHTGGQASFHGGDGRGAQLDGTALAPVLPVTMRPHEGVWDLVPPNRPDPACAPLFALPLDAMPSKGFSRTTAREEARVHWWIGDHPLLATGTCGLGRTAVFTGYLTKPLRGFPLEEDLGSEPLVDVEPHWARADIRAYGPYWPGILELGIGLLAWVTGHEDADPRAIAEAHRQPLFERLATLPATRLEAAIEAWACEPGGGPGRGTVRVRNAGPVVARLVRGTVRSAGTLDDRFRDGFMDLLPGGSVTLRFESAAGPGTESVTLSAQNAEPVIVRLP